MMVADKMPNCLIGPNRPNRLIGPNRPIRLNRLIGPIFPILPITPQVLFLIPAHMGEGDCVGVLTLDRYCKTIKTVKTLGPLR